MSNPLKELLERIGLDPDSAQLVHLDCNVEQDVANLRSRISEIPKKGDPDKAFLKYTLKRVRAAGKELVKSARKQELELEMRLLEKPDDIDLGADENRHIALHLEEEQLQAEGARREGQALLHFCDIIESQTDEDLN